MPELPDVEGFREYVERTSLGKSIASVSVPDDRILEGTTPQALGRFLNGRSISRTVRHGKFLLAGVGSGDWLVLHFGMTGTLEYGSTDTPLPEYSKAVLRFADDTRLAYVCMRLLGRVAITRDRDAYARAQELGPDALDPSLDEEWFASEAGRRRIMLKSLLMDQSFAAGIGNICSDEILFQAKLHPRCRADTLADATRRTLFRVLRRVLETLSERQVSGRPAPEGYLGPHRRTDGRCPVCGTELETVTVNSRKGYFCPACQPAPHE